MEKPQYFFDKVIALYTARMKKLPARAHSLVMSFVLTMLMTVIVSGISTVRAVGFEGLMDHWLGAWLWSWAIAFPTLLVVMPLVRRIVAWIVQAREGR